MATIETVAHLALALPEVVEGTSYRNRCWLVKKKSFVWERPFSKADLRRFDDVTPPDGPIVGVRVGDLAEKEATLAEGQAGVFAIPHFDGFAAVLVQLRVVRAPVLRTLVEEAWLACAPRALGDEYLAARRRR